MVADSCYSRRASPVVFAHCRPCVKLKFGFLSLARAALPAQQSSKGPSVTPPAAGRGQPLLSQVFALRPHQRKLAQSGHQLLLYLRPAARNFLGVADQSPSLLKRCTHGKLAAREAPIHLRMSRIADDRNIFMQAQGPCQQCHGRGYVTTVQVRPSLQHSSILCAAAKCPSH